MKKTHKILEKIFAILRVWEALRREVNIDPNIEDLEPFNLLIKDSAYSFLDSVCLTDEFRNLVFNHFDEIYSQKELEYILEFCDSDAGRKFLSISLLDDCISLVQDYVCSESGANNLKQFIKTKLSDLIDEESGDETEEGEEQRTFDELDLQYKKSEKNPLQKKEEKLRDIFNEPDCSSSEDDPF